MREITAYAANDGTRFFDRDACLLHDAELAIVALAMSGLNLPDNLPHGTFVRVDLDRVWAARDRLVRACRLSDKHKADVLPLIENRTLGNMTMTFRFLDDNGPVTRALSTLDRVDPEGRFWQQHYFLLHPGEGRGEWGGKGRP